MDKAVSNEPQQAGQMVPFDHVYRFYQDYVDAETEYLNYPTGDNWEKKEKAFETFNEALIQNSSHH